MVSKQMDLLEVVKNTIQDYQMVQPGQLILVAVSGGPDSLALLHILNRLRIALGFGLHVAHLDHGFRGQQAQEEANWVYQTARAWGLSCTLKKADVPRFARNAGLSSQDAGHQVRINFLKELAQELQAEKIALGHQADDQAESVLMHFLTGAGLEGLGGMAPVKGVFIRPLIHCRRSEIERYCQEMGLDPRYDPSNKKGIYLRNKIRHQVLPFLQDRVNPALVDALIRTSSIIRDEDDYMQEMMERELTQRINWQGADAELKLTQWEPLPRALQRRLLRKLYQEVRQRQGLSFQQVEKLRRLADSGQVGKILQLPGGVQVKRTYGALLFSQNTTKKDQTMIQARLVAIPGETWVPESGCYLRAELSPVPVVSKAADCVLSMPWEEKRHLILRARLPGDRFSPLGLKGSKKLKAYFIDRKIPCEQRDHVLLIAEGQEVLWIPGLAVSHKCCINGLCGQYLILTLIKHPL